MHIRIDIRSTRYIKFSSKHKQCQEIGNNSQIKLESNRKQISIANNHVLLERQEENKINATDADFEEFQD